MNFRDYCYNGEAKAIRCDTIAFLMRRIDMMDDYFVDCLNNEYEAEAEKALDEIKRLRKRVQNELAVLCK